jgi:hypothetical protein
VKFVQGANLSQPTKWEEIEDVQRVSLASLAKRVWSVRGPNPSWLEKQVKPVQGENPSWPAKQATAGECFEPNPSLQGKQVSEEQHVQPASPASLAKRAKSVQGANLSQAAK